MSLVVRLAAHADGTALIALDKTARTNALRAEQLLNAVVEGHCWVAETGAALAGYAVMTESFFDEGFVSLLYVTPTHRREGIATALIGTVEAACRTPKLFISTNQSNAPMRSLLLKLHYAEVGLVDGLDEGDPEVFYMKPLQGGPKG